MLALAIVLSVLGGGYGGWWAACRAVQGWLERHPIAAQAVASSLVYDAAVARTVARLLAGETAHIASPNLADHVAAAEPDPSCWPTPRQYVNRWESMGDGERLVEAHHIIEDRAELRQLVFSPGPIFATGRTLTPEQTERLQRAWRSQQAEG